jgi:hypothetical protein
VKSDGCVCLLEAPEIQVFFWRNSRNAMTAKFSMDMNKGPTVDAANTRPYCHYPSPFALKISKLAEDFNGEIRELWIACSRVFRAKLFISTVSDMGSV